MRIIPARTQHGLTLVEVMVSIVVGLIMLSGIISIFLSNKQAYRLQESTNVLNENARYALNQLQYDLRMGEHWAGLEPSDVEVDAPLQALAIATACSESPAISGTGFVGIEGDTTSPLDCIPDDDYQPDTDILIVRYAAPERVPSNTAMLSTDIFVRTAIGRRGIIFQGTNIDGLPDSIRPTSPHPTAENELNLEPQAANYRYHTVVYFIRKCASQDRGVPDVCDADDDTTPTLARLVLDGPALVQEDVVAGVEQMQLGFGLSDRTVDPPEIEYLDATTIETNGDWDKVANVQVSLVVRGEQFDVAYVDEREFDMYGDFTYTPVGADRQYRRKLFNFSVQIRNQTRG